MFLDPRRELTDEETLAAAEAINNMMASPGWEWWTEILRGIEYRVGVDGLRRVDKDRAYWLGYQEAIGEILDKPNVLLARAEEVRTRRRAAGVEDDSYRRPTKLPPEYSWQGLKPPNGGATYVPTVPDRKVSEEAFRILFDGASAPLTGEGEWNGRASDSGVPAVQDRGRAEEAPRDRPEADEGDQGGGSAGGGGDPAV